MRTYTQEEWDGRESEIAVQTSRNATANSIANWLNNHEGGPKVWSLIKAMNEGKVAPDVVDRLLHGDSTRKDEAAVTGSSKEISELRAELETLGTTLGRTLLDGMATSARGKHRWADDGDIDRAKSLYGEIGGDRMSFEDCLVMANKDKAFKHLAVPDSSTMQSDQLPRGGPDSLGAERTEVASDPRTAANDAWSRVDAAISAAQSARP